MGSPAFTSHLVISPSCTPSPMSGSLKSMMYSSEIFHFAYRQSHALRVGHVNMLESVRKRRIESRHAHDRSLEIQNGLVRDDRGELSRNPAGLRRLLDDHDTAR